MPIFEYNCHECGCFQEHLVLEGHVPACKDCGSQALSKCLSLFSHKTSSERGYVASDREGRILNRYGKQDVPVESSHKEPSCCHHSYVDQLVKKAEKKGVI